MAHLSLRNTEKLRCLLGAYEERTMFMMHIFFPNSAWGIILLPSEAECFFPNQDFFLLAPSFRQNMSESLD
jgi:hypothetical protein